MLVHGRREAPDGRGLVVLIHGMWLHRISWTPWVELFDSNGYDCIAASWPGEADTVSGCRLAPAATAGMGISEIIGHTGKVIANAGQPPIPIGHGVGGLIALTMLGQTLAAAAICIAPTAAGSAAVTDCAAAPRALVPHPGDFVAHRANAGQGPFSSPLRQHS